MALGGQVRDDIRLELGNRRTDCVGITDVALDEAIAVAGRDALDGR